MKDELVLHIREDKTILVEIREKGVVRTKLIDIDALLDCLTDSMGGIQIQTGILPSNIISLTIHDDSRYAVVEFPDEYADITYMSTTYEHFPLPRLLFGFRLESSGQPGGSGAGKADRKNTHVRLSLLQCQPLFAVYGRQQPPAYSSAAKPAKSSGFYRIHAG